MAIFITLTFSAVSFDDLKTVTRKNIDPNCDIGRALEIHGLHDDGTSETAVAAGEAIHQRHNPKGPVLAKRINTQHDTWIIGGRFKD